MKNFTGKIKNGLRETLDPRTVNGDKCFSQTLILPFLVQNSLDKPKNGVYIAIKILFDVYVVVFSLYRESNLRFVSNESTSTPAKLHQKLTRLGFDLKQQHLFTPAPVAARYVQKRGLQPHLLIHKGKFP